MAKNIIIFSDGTGQVGGLRPDERPDLGIGLGLPPAAMEYSIMADLELKVVGLFCRNDASAEQMRGDGLAGRANIVPFTLDGHQGGALDGRRLDQLSPHPEAAPRQVVVMKYALDGVQIEIRRQIHH